MRAAEVLDNYVFVDLQLAILAFKTILRQRYYLRVAIIHSAIELLSIL